MIIRIVDCNEKNLINAHAIDARWLDLFHFSLVKFLYVLPATVHCFCVGMFVCQWQSIKLFIVKKNVMLIQKTLNDGGEDVIKTLALNNFFLVSERTRLWSLKKSSFYDFKWKICHFIEMKNFTKFIIHFFIHKIALSIAFICEATTMMTIESNNLYFNFRIN